MKSCLHVAKATPLSTKTKGCNSLFIGWNIEKFGDGEFQFVQNSDGSVECDNYNLNRHSVGYILSEFIEMMEIEEEGDERMEELSDLSLDVVEVSPNIFKTICFNKTNKNELKLFFSELLKESKFKY